MATKLSPQAGANQSSSSPSSDDIFDLIGVSSDSGGASAIAVETGAEGPDGASVVHELAAQQDAEGVRSAWLEGAVGQGQEWEGLILSQTLFIPPMPAVLINSDPSRNPNIQCISAIGPPCY